VPSYFQEMDGAQKLFMLPVILNSLHVGGDSYTMTLPLLFNIVQCEVG
jgi:hypothetical protein